MSKKRKYSLGSAKENTKAISRKAQTSAWIAVGCSVDKKRRDKINLFSSQKCRAKSCCGAKGEYGGLLTSLDLEEVVVASALLIYRKQKLYMILGIGTRRLGRNR